MALSAGGYVSTLPVPTPSVHALAYFLRDPNARRSTPAARRRKRIRSRTSSAPDSVPPVSVPPAQTQRAIVFTAEQRQWLDAIKDHIAKSLRIEQEDFDEVPFNTIGGLGRVHELFRERLPVILDELNRRLAA